MAKRSSINPSHILFDVFVAVSAMFSLSVESHNESGDWSCESDSGARIVADFRPGIVTLDGRADDWKDVDGLEFSLLPALDPHQDDAYKAGKMTVKALHDGKDVFFLLQVDGDYAYSKGEGKRCPSIALMFQIGENATYHDMGGCKESQSSCTNKSCRGYEVDLMHFALGDAIPGRLYGGNPVDIGYGGDRFGHLVDFYSLNPHCRFPDGRGPSGNNANDTGAQNDWKGAWWHTSLAFHSGFVEGDSPYGSNGSKGIYYFEFSRPLRTMDRFQQDVQFKIGETSNFSAAFWYPVDGSPWQGSSHFTIGCEWLTLELISAKTGSSYAWLKRVGPRSPWAAVLAICLFLSVAALGVSAFIGFRLSRNRGVPFTPMVSMQGRPGMYS